MKGINLNRLEKICGNNLTIFQKQAIYEWGKQYEDLLSSELRKEFKDEYEKDLGTAVNHFIVAIAFVLHFGEKTRFGSKRLFEVLKDIEETVDMFRKKEYSAQDYLKMLHDDGINLNIK